MGKVPENSKDGEIGFLQELYNLDVLFHRNNKLIRNITEAIELWVNIWNELGFEGVTSMDKKRSGDGQDEQGPNKRVRSGARSKGATDMRDSDDFEVDDSEDPGDSDANSEWTKLKVFFQTFFHYFNSTKTH